MSRLTIAAILLVSCLISGCAPQKVQMDPNDPLMGTWISTEDGLKLTFLSDIRYEVVSAKVGGPTFQGTLQREGNRLRFMNDKSSGLCRNQLGTYTYKVSANKVNFVLVDDKCKGRRNYLISGWKRG